MSTFTIEIAEISVTCSSCGADLKVNLNRTQDELEVEPCSECIVDSYNEGYDTAKKEALNG